METPDRTDRRQMVRNALPNSRRMAQVLAGALAVVFFAAPVLRAEDKKNPSGSPLDTILQTRLWADVPEARDFVRENRPPTDSLDYQPTARTDPQRPAPRTKAELEALRSELESGIAHNEASAGRRGQAKPAANAQKAKVAGAGSN